MSAPSDPVWGPRLARLAASETNAPVADLARRLLRLTRPVGEGLARRLLAAAVGVPSERVPERLGRASLPALLYGEVVERPLEGADFLVVDLETTGLSDRRARILEIGAVRVSSLRRAGTFHTLCDPGMAIPAHITRLTGIDAEAVRGAPSVVTATRAFAAWLRRFPGAPFVAHNASFDQRFTERALARAGLGGLERPVLCTRRLARRLLPELPRVGLDPLCAHLGISNPARHRALGDAQATAQALITLLELAREAGQRTLGDLLELQGRSGRRRSSRPRRAGAGGKAA